MPPYPAAPGPRGEQRSGPSAAPLPDEAPSDRVRAADARGSGTAGSVARDAGGAVPPSTPLPTNAPPPDGTDRSSPPATPGRPPWLLTPLPGLERPAPRPSRAVPHWRNDPAPVRQRHPRLGRTHPNDAPTVPARSRRSGSCSPRTPTADRTPRTPQRLDDPATVVDHRPCHLTTSGEPLAPGHYAHLALMARTTT